MKNKVLIKVYVPTLDELYEVSIPTNETIKKILELIVKIICEFSDSEFTIEDNKLLIDPENAKPYLESNLVRDTNIRNSKLLLLI